MKPTQTLDQALTDGENAIAPALEHWLAQEQSTRTAAPGRRPGPYEVRISFGALGEGRKSVLDVTWTAEQAVPAAVPGLLQMAKEKLHEQWGPSPMGQLRVKVYHDNESGRSDKFFESARSIAPGAEEFGGSPGDVVYLRQQNMQLHNTVLGMTAQVVLAVQHMGTIVAEQGKSIATLATARTAGSASADSGGIWGIASLIAVAVTWPIIQESLGVQGATLPDMLKIFQVKAAAVIRGDKSRAAEEGQVPEGAPTPPPELVDAEANGVPRAEIVTSMLEALRADSSLAEDPELIRELAQLAKRNPKLKTDMITAFASA